MKPFSYVSTLLLWVLSATCLLAQPTAELRFAPALDCQAGTFEARLQIRALGADPVQIGTSSIYLTYNPQAIQFEGYQSENFDQKGSCFQGVSAYTPHLYDGLSKPGAFNLTMVLNQAGKGCPEVTQDAWVDVGVVSFRIADPRQAPELAFRREHTHFNHHEFNDGTHELRKGELMARRGRPLNCEDWYPMELEDFQVVPNGLGARLSWMMIQNQPGSKFVIERSVDGLVFETIGHLTADPDTVASYVYDDPEIRKLTDSKVFYRIKMVDHARQQRHSEVESLEWTDLKRMYTLLSPNPAQQYTELAYTLAEAGSLELKVINAMGQLVHGQRIQAPSGASSRRLDVQQWPSGIYTVHLSFQQQTEVHKLVIP